MYAEFSLEHLPSYVFIFGYITYGFIVFFSDYRAHWMENKADLLQPWKLVTLAAGLVWLLYGALTYHFADWDVGVSLIMAGLTYVSAPWCARAVRYRKWRLIAGVIIAWWFCVDGSYSLWHTIAGNSMMRDANITASSALFWLCAVIWMPIGSIRSITQFSAQRQQHLRQDR